MAIGMPRSEVMYASQKAHPEKPERTVLKKNVRRWTVAHSISQTKLTRPAFTPSCERRQFKNRISDITECDSRADQGSSIVDIKFQQQIFPVCVDGGSSDFQSLRDFAVC